MYATLGLIEAITSDLLISDSDSACVVVVFKFIDTNYSLQIET